MQRVAMLSVHTSPLAQPGTGDGGGMNVYVRALGVGAGACGRRGRRPDPRRAPRAAAVRRGRARLPRAARRGRPVPRSPLRELPGARRRVQRPRPAASERRTTVRRAARQLLGVGRGRPPAEARARSAARHHLPHARPREGRGRPRRRRAAAPRVEAEVVRCADLVVASTFEERDQLVRHYGADPVRSRSSRRASTTGCSRRATALRAGTSALGRARPCSSSGASSP